MLSLLQVHERKLHSENFTLTFYTCSQCFHSGSFSLLLQCTPPAARFLLQPLLSQLSPLINQLFTSTIYYSLSSNWTSFKSTVCPQVATQYNHKLVSPNINSVLLLPDQQVPGAKLPSLEAQTQYAPARLQLTAKNVRGLLKYGA